jgi:DNA-binding CsgD family transcriptional regulator
MNKTFGQLALHRRAWDATPMPDIVKEAIADALLASTQSKDDHPAYSEEAIGRKSQRAKKAEEQFCLLVASSHSNINTEEMDVLKKSNLSSEERQVAKLYALGLKTRQIARATGLTRGKVIRIGRRIALLTERSKSPDQGWKEVYHQEVNRPVYHKPNHCTEQPCRKLGYCKYAGC